MPLTQEAKKRLQELQDEAGDILAEIAEIFPSDYYFTLVCRHQISTEEADIVLTNDVLDEAIDALERNKLKMENAE